MKQAEIKELSVEELQQKLAELKKRICRFENGTHCDTIGKSVADQKNKKNGGEVGD